MNKQDLIQEAEKAAADYSPSIMNQDPGMIRFARRCYAEGYEHGLRRAADMVAMGGAYKISTR